MKLCLEKLKTYLAEHPQKYSYGDIDGLLDILFWDYLQYNPVTNDEVRSKTREAEAYMGALSGSEIDDVFACFFRMCLEYQRLFFIDGARVGARLALELTEA